MAPEQWRGATIDPRTDLYALGGVLYELLAGRRAFDGDPASLMHKHIYEAHRPLPDSVPQNLRALVHWLLEKDANTRPADAASVVRWLERDDIRAATDSPGEREAEAGAATPAARSALPKSHTPEAPREKAEVRETRPTEVEAPRATERQRAESPLPLGSRLQSRPPVQTPSYAK